MVFGTSYCRCVCPRLKLTLSRGTNNNNIGSWKARRRRCSMFDSSILSCLISCSMSREIIRGIWIDAFSGLLQFFPILNRLTNPDTISILNPFVITTYVPQLMGKSKSVRVKIPSFVSKTDFPNSVPFVF